MCEDEEADGKASLKALKHLSYLKHEYKFKK
jgi:hypothetical protein